MIRNSFVFLEGVSLRSEQNIWQQGVTDWGSFIDAGRIKGFSPKRKMYYSKQLRRAQRFLFDYDSSFFTSFPSSEAWRLYDHFRDDCLFLDIETTGYYGDISVIGCFDGYDVMTLVKHRSLDKRNLKRIFRGKQLLVTFNGLSFDVPVIKRCFGDVLPDIPHLDLRFPLARLGYAGGLKSVERSLGIVRCKDSFGLVGSDAVGLWHEYLLTGSSKALDLLVKYNEGDIVNLKPLADFVFDHLSEDLKLRFRL